MGAQLVEGIPISPMPQGQVLWQHPGQRDGLPASHGLQGDSHITGKRWLMHHLALPGDAWVKGLPSPKGLPRILRLLSSVMGTNSGSTHSPSEVCCPIWNATRDALQSSTRAPQMPHPLLERGDLLDLDMLDVVRKDPMTSAPAEKASSLRPRVEKPISVSGSSKPTTLEPEEAAQPEEFALVLRSRPLAPLGFTLSWVDESLPPPQEEADWPMSIPLGTQLDFASLGSLQVTISHYPVMGKV